MTAAHLADLLGPWAPEHGRLPDSLADAIADLVEQGFVPAGIMLPPQRELAASLGIARGTVASAVSILVERGYATARRGSGVRIRSGKATAQTGMSGRLFSFTNASAELADLSTGALPASRVAREVLAGGVRELDPYLDTDGYFPAGLPVLRQTIADYLTRRHTPTKPSEILVTTGAQHATQLAVRSVVAPGDLVLCDDPTYRGALEVFNSEGVRVQGIPMRGDGLDVALLEQAMKRGPELLYCQTSIHNPTGRTTSTTMRKAIAGVVNDSSVQVIEDCCSADLSLGVGAAPSLAGLVDPDRLIGCWTCSKLFWGGLRIGWIRASAPRIRVLTELRKVGDLATSVVDQLLAVRMLQRVEEARDERRTLLHDQLARTEAVLRELRPKWRWEPIHGGPCLWVDTGEDAALLAERAKRVGVKLAPGPRFSPHDGHRTMLRIPVWHDQESLRAALMVC
ncbi:PLP-dependent aminotransferase family protein [Cutibacterium equinum]|uniref:PLP-dependent aminotransferase family protein n=1 Tax=Cutibacterium equinum TaxID=3016342 RepID=A0ABY7QXU4_9ACTN|nr:PLP-dependent aminotransferase family protein [Cutibacterium equinum]WCC79867.1 PLP-dependent aminotransferase family protein [Cutibacterium equinum]